MAQDSARPYMLPVVRRLREMFAYISIELHPQTVDFYRELSAELGKGLGILETVIHVPEQQVLERGASSRLIHEILDGFRQLR